MADSAAKKKTTKAKEKPKAKDAESKQETEKKAAPVVVKEKSLEELVLSKMTGKYEVVDTISVWAKQLRSQEAHRHLTQTEVIELAMREVLSGKVTAKEVNKNRVHGVPINATEETEAKSAAKK